MPLKMNINITICVDEDFYKELIANKASDEYEALWPRSEYIRTLLREALDIRKACKKIMKPTPKYGLDTPP